MACRRRDSSIPSTTSYTKPFSWFFVCFQFWSPSQSSRTFSLVFVLDDAVTSGDIERRGSPVVPLASSLLSRIIIPELTQEEPYLSRGNILITYESYFIVLLKYFRSGSASASLKAFNHRNSLTARAPPPPAIVKDHPWLSFEPSRNFWLSWALGPSPARSSALSPVKPSTARSETLTWLEVSSIGLGPQPCQHEHGPTYYQSKPIIKGCGPSLFSAWPRSVYPYLTGKIDTLSRLT